jgi:enoyl-CoA hydratase/carnithine racemase
VKVIVMRGEGRDFCSGFEVTDPRDFEGSVEDSRRVRLASIREKADWMRELLQCEKPLVVSVHGACVGIGTYIVLVADFAIVTSDAALGLPEERFGSAGATWVYPYLIREIGMKRANEIVMTGRRISADEALSYGLVNRVVSPAELATATDGLARALCTLPREGIALNRTVKQLALSVSGQLTSFDLHSVTHALAERMQREADEFDFMAHIARDGMRAAIEERNRRFAGEWWGW